MKIKLTISKMVGITKNNPFKFTKEDKMDFNEL
jgi:hypothetical protein